MNDRMKRSLKNEWFADFRWFSSKSNLFADFEFVDASNDQIIDHLQICLKKEFFIIIVHTDMKNINSDSFAYVMISERYISEKFYEMMIDSNASTKSTVEYDQYLVFKKHKIDSFIDLDVIKTETVNIQFDIESARSIKSLIIDTSFEVVKFHVIKTDISFLLSLADMNRLKVYFNNVKNILIMIAQFEKSSLSIIRRFDHEFLLWKNFMQTYIDQSFNLNLCYLIETKLRQLHKRFDHSSIRKLYDLLERFDHEVKKSVLKKLIKFCTFCQKHEKSSERFKFTLRDDVNMNFNYSVIVDVMYIENNLILHVIDEVTRFQAARWLQNISVKHIWEILRLCWIDVYLNSSDHILHDADKNFVSRKFRQFVISMTIIIKAISMKTHWSIDIVKRYHAELRRAYQMIFENIDIVTSKEIMLQMTVKTVNDTADSDELMSKLLIFDVYSRMHVMNSSISSINQRAMTIEKAMIEMRKFRAERQVADALNIRNDLIIISIHDLFLNSNVLIWRENRKWIESFKLLNMNDEICKIELSSESIDFRSTVIKSFLIESSIDDVQSINEKVQSIDSSDDENQNFASEISARLIRAKRLSLRYQNFADITVFLQDEVDSSFVSIFTSTFIESRRKEINDLLKRQIFEIIIISEVLKNVRIFNFRFVDEIKHSDTSQAYEKSRLMIQTYNDHERH